MGATGRRGFLKAAAAAAAAAPIERALALPARAGGGGIMDLEHVVILMQENRSFDHYFGCLRGVRGFGDPRAIDLPGGFPVWAQPGPTGGTRHYPFRLDARATSAECIASLDHSWKGSHELWRRHDAWIKTKTPMTMGHFQREDIPFYYALADAFTVCDAYHASIFGPTNPNRMFLFSGTCGLNVGLESSLAVTNPVAETNETADPQRDGPHFPGYEWTTYAERLQAAGVTWKLYQEYDNFGDNGLAYFKAFRGLDPGSPLYLKGRAWVDGSTSQNAKISRGEHLLAAFRRDVMADALPQVSWIVAPTLLSEHPSATPSYGEQLTGRLLEALTARPEVWAKTAFILNYDENDGFFDHAPPPVPAVAGALGRGNIDTAGEVYNGVPVGLGPRVPMIVVSPWTKGGFVNSELFDHTSVIRLLEARFGVREPNITPWRRAVCGDLTSVFDFAAPNASAPRLPATDRYIAAADLAARLPRPAPPAVSGVPRQERGGRPARPLPYDLHASGVMAADGFHLAFENRGPAGAVFRVAAAGGEEGPWFYSVAARSRLSDVIPLPVGPFDVSLHGPNGFYRRWKADRIDMSSPSTAFRRDPVSDRLVVSVSNPGSSDAVVKIVNAYEDPKGRLHTLKPRTTIEAAWPLAKSDHWYDVAVTIPADGSYYHHFAGHFETGRPSRSDPLIASPAAVSRPL